MAEKPHENGLARPLRRDAQRNRELILAAARELFAERGIAATLDDVAARAGVGVATVYRRYPNKDALLNELFEDLFEEGTARFTALAEESVRSHDPWQALVGFIERIEEEFAANRALGELVMSSNDGLKRNAQAHEQLMAAVATLVERAKADGRLRADFEAADVEMIHTMLAAVVRETHASSPNLWRRYFALIVDGMARERTAPLSAVASPHA